MAAMDTAGRAVVFAGVTVVVSLLGLLLIGLEFVAGLGISAAVTVAVTMLASHHAAARPCSASPSSRSRSPGGVASSPPASSPSRSSASGLGITPLQPRAPARRPHRASSGSFVPVLKREVPKRDPEAGRARAAGTGGAT